jgi:predicted nucleotidyltransferase
MKNYLRMFNEFLEEAKDPSYYQETFHFTMLISMSKEKGGSRDETKNDIRALPEVLTVTLVEREKGGVQKDLGTKYLSTLKIHIRRPRDISKQIMMKRIVKHCGQFTGVSVLRYKERKPKQRKQAFRGPGSYKITEESSYQKSPERAKRNREGFEQLTKKGPNDSGPLKKVEDDPDWEQAPPAAAGGLEEERGDDPPSREGVKIILRRKDKYHTFDLQPDLNTKIWDDDEQLRPGVKAALEDIVEEFMISLDLDVEIKDIIITGSIANYNWSKYSDIDLHILVDFDEVNDNEVMVKRFFDSVRANWNKLHDIKVKNHEVEIYIQNEKESHVSTGVYSLHQNRWLTKPERHEPVINRGSAVQKADSLEREIEKVERRLEGGDIEGSLEVASALREKIKSMRQAGLAAAGIFSPENLAFKRIRRSGAIGRLHDTYTKAYDLSLSLDQ